MSLPASPPEIVALMRLLTDPTRWRIYGVLRQRAASVGELADALAMPRCVSLSCACSIQRP